MLESLDGIEIVAFEPRGGAGVNLPRIHDYNGREPRVPTGCSGSPRGTRPREGSARCLRARGEDVKLSCDGALRHRQ